MMFVCPRRRANIAPLAMPEFWHTSRGAALMPFVHPFFHRQNALAVASARLIDGKQWKTFRYGRLKNGEVLGSSNLGTQRAKRLQKTYVHDVELKPKTWPIKYSQKFGRCFPHCSDCRLGQIWKTSFESHHPLLSAFLSHCKQYSVMHHTLSFTMNWNKFSRNLVKVINITT